MKNTYTKGFTLVEIMFVSFVIAVLAAIAIPNFLRARANTQINVCIANLKRISTAKDLAILDGAGITMQDLVPVYIKQTPACPAGGNYTVGAVAVDPTCSIGGAHILP